MCYRPEGNRKEVIVLNLVSLFNLFVYFVLEKETEKQKSKKQKEGKKEKTKESKKKKFSLGFC